VELAKYLDWLFEKYNCADKGSKYLMKIITPKERAKIRDFWDRILAQ